MVGEISGVEANQELGGLFSSMYLYKKLLKIMSSS